MAAATVVMEATVAEITNAERYCWVPKTAQGFLLWLDLTRGLYASTGDINMAVRSTELGKPKFAKGMGVYLRGWAEIKVDA